MLKLFLDLKQDLNRVEDLRLIEAQVFLAPFLEVIRTADTTGPLTSLALASVNKFLSYGLIGKFFRFRSFFHSKEYFFRSHHSEPL